MITVSNAFRTALNNDQRNYLLYADLTLKNGTSLSITNEDLWNDGFSINDAVSSDNNFDIGAAIINNGKLVLNNIYPLTQSTGRFSSYDFTDARVVLWVGLNLNGSVERIRKGTFVVDEAKYNGSLITLSLLDYMSKFDRPYSGSTLRYPTTLGAIVSDACNRCDVELNTYSFPHSDHPVSTRPSDSALTYREMISYVAQIAGCFARCDVYGRLELKWFPKTFTGNNVHTLPATFSHDLGVDDIVFTGVAVNETYTVTETSSESQDSSQSGSSTQGSSSGSQEETPTTTKEVSRRCLSGSDGYVLTIDKNPLVQDKNGQTIANWLGDQLITPDFRFRHGELSHLSDPTIEAGDLARFTDVRGNIYNILISSTKFTAGNAQTTRSSAQTPERNSAQRFSEMAKTYVEFKEKIEKEKTARELALESLAQRIAESPGLYTTIETQENDSKIYYFHNMPTLAESNIVWKMTAEAFGVTTDYQGDQTTWNAGLTVDGDAVLRALSTVSIDTELLNLYGLMTVYQQQDQSNIGGYIGYGKGYTGANPTDGIMLSSTNNRDAGTPTTNNRYVIITTKGARIAAGDNYFYLTDNLVEGQSSGNAVIHAVNNIVMEIGGALKIKDASVLGSSELTGFTAGEAPSYTFHIGPATLRIFKGIVIGGTEWTKAEYDALVARIDSGGGGGSGGGTAVFG